ncbi:MAG: helix-turn-helix transcriptional regulator [Okeania sp. SIO2D1]|nr:helix-turn-helix transcriptional regulator [Okeania sp. SIO2D1]
MPKLGRKRGFRLSGVGWGKYLKAKQGKTQEQIAVEANLDRRIISKLENNRGISLDSFTAIFLALNTPLDTSDYTRVISTKNSMNENDKSLEEIEENIDNMSLEEIEEVLEEIENLSDKAQAVIEKLRQKQQEQQE